LAEQRGSGPAGGGESADTEKPAAAEGRERIAYLGPAGTFTEDALREALAGEDRGAAGSAGGGGAFTPLRTATIPEALEAVAEGRADRALAPFENSIEGSVRAVLDALALEVEGVTIVGEHDYVVRPQLIARRSVALGEITAVLSHPQPLAQCARFLRAEVPGAELRAVSSTAQAVREVSERNEEGRAVSEGGEVLAALGAISAAELYGCEILREAEPDAVDNVTRFVWIAPEGTDPGPGSEWKTSLVFSELGADHPGALVEALHEFSSRDVNLSRIESRPLRQGLGRYMFFLDIEGGLDEPPVAEAIAQLRAKAERVTLLGSYPTRR